MYIWIRKKKTTREVLYGKRKQKNTKPADEEIEKTAEPTAGEEKQPETEKAESDTAAAKEEQPEKKGFFGKKKEKKDKKDEQIEELTDRLKRQMAEFDKFP